MVAHMIDGAKFCATTGGDTAKGIHQMSRSAPSTKIEERMLSWPLGLGPGIAQEWPRLGTCTAISRLVLEATHLADWADNLVYLTTLLSARSPTIVHQSET